MTSDLAKPDGLLVVEPGTEEEFLAPLPVTRLWGVGPATFAKLDRMGLRTVGDVARMPEHALVAALGGSLGRHLWALSHNDDDRAVEPERETKSVGAEETYDQDLRTPDACDRELVRLTERVTTRLRHHHFTARTITLKIRFGDFETRTRSRTLPVATDVSTVVLATARSLIEAFEVERGVRLLGISMSNLDNEQGAQGVLALDEPVAIDDERVNRFAAVERAADAVRDRFGDFAVRPATLAEGKAKPR